MTRLEKGTLYNEDMRGITTSSPVFEHLIQHNLTYVDKTNTYILLYPQHKAASILSRDQEDGENRSSAILWNLSSKALGFIQRPLHLR